VIKRVKRWQSPKNLLVIRLTEKELSNPEVSQFVCDMRDHFMGDLVDTSLSKGKPLQMMPYLKVQKDVEIIKKLPSTSVGELIMKYLVEISLYINSTCCLDCDICGSAYKQFLCCTRTKYGKEELDILSLKDLFQQLKGVPLDRVNILGGDIFKFSKLEQLLELLKRPGQSFKKVFYIHYLNLFHREENLALFPADTFFFNLLVTFPVRENQWKKALELLDALGMSVQFFFIISSEAEVSDAEELISLYHLDNYSFFPFFNGRNREFFEQNVFLDREDLREARPTFKEILARQCVNPLHFGTLTVLSNGHIHANVNAPRLGILGSNSIYEVVYREMDRGNSWRRIRKKVEPCKRCTFEALCPPLSNYEYALGRNNLCHIRDRI
jgi:pseudo-rSAM protein